MLQTETVRSSGHHAEPKSVELQAQLRVATNALRSDKPRF